MVPTYEFWSLDIFSLDRDGQMKMDIVTDNFLHVLQKNILSRDKWVDLKKQEDLGMYVIEGFRGDLSNSRHWKFKNFTEKVSINEVWFLVFCKTRKKLSDTKDFRSIFICPSLLREKKSKLQTSYKGTFWCQFLNFERPELLRSPLNYSIWKFLS